jgi:trimethylamine--corrinoid protein Co-methyltransferase
VVRARIEYLGDAQKDYVHEQTMRVLEEVGVAYNTPMAIDLLEEAGAQVDRDALTAKLPRELVQRCLETVPDTVVLAARDPANDRVLCIGGPPLFTTDGTATYVLDDLTGERREGTADDLRVALRLFDALPEIDFVWPSVHPRDLDPLTVGLECSCISLLACSKHVQDEVLTPDIVPPLLEILEAIAGAPVRERPIYSVINCTIAPLMHDGPMTEAGIALARAGVPIFILPMVLMGTTGPMTVLGTCILNMAEALSAVVLYQLASPGCPLVAGIGSAAAEMRSGLYLCATPEVALINLLCGEMGHFYGLPTQGSAIGSDAKAVNVQAGVEAGVTGVLEALGALDCVIAFGLLDGAQVLSYGKTVVDAETVAMIKRLLRGDAVDESTALFDEIAAIGIGGHYLAAKSTRRFHRDGELWEPSLFQRGPFENYIGRPLLEAAVEKARDLIATHTVAPVSEDVARHVEETLAAFARTKGAARRV